MATIKNKTSLREGMILWDDQLAQYTVVELKTLTNRIIYVELQYKDSQNYIPCAMYNRKNEERIHCIEYADEFFMNHNEAVAANKNYKQKSKLWNLGFNVCEILKAIPK